MHRDGDIGDGKRAADEAVVRRDGFQVGHHLRQVVAQRGVDGAVVARQFPHAGLDDGVVEQFPDEHVAHAGIGEFLQPARFGAGRRPGREQRRLGVAFVEILTDRRAVGQCHLIVDENRDAAQRAEAGEFVVALERHNRVAAPGNTLKLADHHDLAGVWGARAADDGGRLHGLGVLGSGAGLQFAAAQVFPQRGGFALLARQQRRLGGGGQSGFIGQGLSSRCHSLLLPRATA